MGPTRQVGSTRRCNGEGLNDVHVGPPDALSGIPSARLDLVVESRLGSML